MPTYAIGDIQGCFSALKKLLEKIEFSPNKDILWFTGDLVNRGPQSLETLRFIKNLGSQHKIVLGNHDLHLLAIQQGGHPGSSDDTLQAILQAPDCEELLEWLSHQSLLHHDASLGFTMVHAGLAPNWDLEKAKQLAHEVEFVLQNNKSDFFKHMYGNQPDYWDDSLKGFDRLRCITNYFTRVRFCYPDGRLELHAKGKLESNPELVPWFKLPQRINKDLKIIFGHWAALEGITNTPNVYALDTGCVWGNELTAMRLEDGTVYGAKG